jgi:hypothetical protein
LDEFQILPELKEFGSGEIKEALKVNTRKMQATVKRNIMNTKTLQLAILGSALVLATQARATLFDITFLGNDGTKAEAQVTATDLGGDVFQAVSGSITVNPGSMPFLAGTWTLYQNPNGINASYSPSGYFIYDNLVLPNADPMNTYPGLLFRLASSGYEVNLYSDGADTYILYDNHGRHVNGSMTVVDPPSSVVPEPTTMLAGALLLLPFGVSTIRIVRRNRRA